MQLRYRYSYCLIGMGLIPLLGRLALSGSGHSEDWYRYLIPAAVGAASGFLLGQMKEQWLAKTAALEAEIRHRRDIEQELVSQKNSLAVTLGSIGDGVITTDIDARVMLINRVGEQLTGWSQEEAFGQPAAEVFPLIHEQSGRPCPSPVEQVLSSKAICSATVSALLVAKNAPPYPVEERCAPIFDQGSRLLGTVLVFRDVSEERRTAEELFKVRKLESPGVLAGGIAHDFNNILMGIHGNIDLAGTYLAADSRARPLLHRAQQASFRARDLTKQLLTFSKGGEPIPTTASVAKIITDSAGFILHGSPVACEYSLPPELWLAEIDPGQISQVIQNIVLNARQAMPEGGTIRIIAANVADSSGAACSSQPRGKALQITITDSGPGIPAENLDKIFDPYYTTKAEGNGLGLAISHSIIQKHGGGLEVESQPNQGTSFRISLPAAREQTIARHREQAARVSAAAKRVMVMDDDPFILDLSQQMLLQFGHEPVLAKSGHEALELYQHHHGSAHPIDILILDLTLPGCMGGREVLQRILALTPEAKAIVTSGYSNDSVLTNYRQHGFSATISKPFVMAELQATIDQLSEQPPVGKEP
ncbi:hybrid sensor histidine kinase/response regulator [Desulfogranum mediterraneum]|uniref:hybrid sensor histidine kinase/response regulator n=1 Tax=Desulfogranum mediterraneum TaxID=160661 RepID=UPI00041AC760|nr:ATP-binding protein [Desulfogranum mediterraneum]